MVVKDRRMADDVSIIVADMLPDATTNFPASALKDSSAATVSSTPAKGGGGGFFSCFGGGGVRDEEAPAAQHALHSAVLDYVADVDCLQVRPTACGSTACNDQDALLPIGAVVCWCEHTPGLLLPALQAFPHLASNLLSHDRASSSDARKRDLGDVTVHGARTARRFRQEADWHTDESYNGKDKSGGEAAHPVPLPVGLVRSSSAEWEREQEPGASTPMPAGRSAPASSLLSQQVDGSHPSSILPEDDLDGSLPSAL